MNRATIKTTTIGSRLVKSFAPKKKEVKKEIPPVEPALSPQLKEAFTKVALDMGCNYNEVYSMISDLDRAKYASWYDEFREEFDRQRYNGFFKMDQFKKQFPGWVK